MEEAKGHVTARAEGVVVIIKASLEKGEATRFSVAISEKVDVIVKRILKELKLESVDEQMPKLVLQYSSSSGQRWPFRTEDDFRKAIDDSEKFTHLGDNKYHKAIRLIFTAAASSAPLAIPIESSELSECLMKGDCSSKLARKRIDAWLAAASSNGCKFDPNTRHGGKNWTLLHMAVVADDGDLVSRILQVKGFDANAHDKDGYAPIHLAASLGNATCLDQLLKCSGVDRDAKVSFTNSSRLVSISTKGQVIYRIPWFHE